MNPQQKFDKLIQLTTKIAHGQDIHDIDPNEIDFDLSILNLNNEEIWDLYQFFNQIPRTEKSIKDLKEYDDLSTGNRWLNWQKPEVDQGPMFTMIYYNLAHTAHALKTYILEHKDEYLH